MIVRIVRGDRVDHRVRPDCEDRWDRSNNENSSYGGLCVNWHVLIGSTIHFFMSKSFIMNESGHYPLDNTLITVYFWQLLLTIPN